MDPRPSMWRELLSELRRRRVPQVAVAYLIAAWVVIQVVVTITDPLHLPPSSQTLVIVLAVLGFPLTLVIAWAFEITPEGVKRTSDREGVEGDLPPIRRSTRLLGVVVGSVLVLAVGWGAWWVWVRTASTDTAKASEVASARALDPNHVAVLYLSDYSRGHTLGYLAEGITETLIHELSDVQGLSVVSSNGVKPFRDRALADDSIGRVLHVGSIVDGSVQRSGDSLRVTVQLVDAATGTQLASKQIDRPSEELFALQDSVSSQVARFLRQRLGKEIELRRARKGTQDQAAWKAYRVAIRLREDADSLRFAHDTAGARESYSRVDSLLSVAEDRDPHWTRPTIERGWLDLTLARLPNPRLPRADTLLLHAGLDHADRILHGDPANARALELKGNLEFFLSEAEPSSASEKTLASAERDLRASTVEDPGRARAWARLANIHHEKGEFAAARAALRHSTEADPYLFHDVDYLFLLAQLALDLNEVDRAVQILQDAQQRFPLEPAYPALQLVALASSEGGRARVPRAWALLRKVEDRLPTHSYPSGKLLVAAVLARAGLSDSARAVEGRARALAPKDPMEPYYEAYVELQLGETDRALALLHRHLDAMPQRRSFIANDWWWTPLRSDPRFQALVDAGADSSG